MGSMQGYGEELNMGQTSNPILALINSGIRKMDILCLIFKEVLSVICEQDVRMSLFSCLVFKHLCFKKRLGMSGESGGTSFQRKCGNLEQVH